MISVNHTKKKFRRGFDEPNHEKEERARFPLAPETSEHLILGLI